MKKAFSCFFLFFALFIGIQAHELNYPFIFNKGQWETDVLYRAELGGGSMWIEKNGITYAFFDHKKLVAIHDGLDNFPEISQDPWIKAHSVKVKFLNSNSKPAYTHFSPSSDYKNYFVGDQSKWRSEVYSYNSILGKDLYPGIDIRYKDDHSSLKYEFIVAPGANPNLIEMQYLGPKSMRIDDFGNLVITTSVNTFLENKPFVYQVKGTDTIEISSRFVLQDNKVKFMLGEYNSELPLIIDPTLIFSTYSGSSADNFGFTATYDSKGYLYSGGNVFALGYPTTVGAFQVSYGGGNIDVAITKYDVTGTNLIYSTYLGGNGSEIPHSLVVNNYDELFVFGTTGSANFPVSANAYDQTFNGGTNITGVGMGFVYPNGCDIFITRFNVAGTAIQASTYLGGSGNDGINVAGGLKANYADESRGEIDIDKLNYIYLATTTSSTNFPVSPNAFQTTYGGGTQDGLVAKMDNNLTTVLFASYIGGSSADAIYSLALGTNLGSIIIAGGTASTNFPTVGSNFTTHNGGVDGFVARVSSNGATLLKSIVFGTPQYDQIYFVEVDKQDHIFVLGQTNHAAGYFYQNAIYGIPNGGQFITKFKPTLDTVEWSTSFGLGNGHADISPSAFLVDVCNKIYISGWGGLVNNSIVPGSTVTGLDITPGAFQPSTTGSDFYLMVMEDNASSLTYSTFFGGPTSAEHVDGGTSRFNRKGEIYQSVCAGCGANSDFPIAPANAWSPTNNSFNCNVGVFKFKFDFPMIVADFDIPPAACAPVNLTMTNLSEGATNYLWTVSDGQTSTSTNPTFNFTTGGVYEVTLYALNPSGTTCNLVDSITKQVVVLGNSIQTLPDIETCEYDNFEIGLPPSGLPGVTYTWIPSTGLSDPTISNPIFNPSVGSQTYSLIISNGSCSDSLDQQITVSPLQNINFNDTMVCVGTTINLGSTNLPSSYTYSWSPSAGLSNPTSPNPSVTINASTVYQLVYSHLTCSDTATREVLVLDSQSIQPNDTTVCASDVFQVNDIPFFTGVTYQWIPNQNVDNPNIHNPNIWVDQNTTFLIIIDNGICKDTVEKVVDVFQIQGSLGPDIVKCKNDSVAIGFTPISGYSYHWSPATGLTNAGVSNPISYVGTTTQYVLETSLDNTSCVAYDTIVVEVQQLGIPPILFAEGLTCSGMVYTPDLIANPAYNYYWTVEPGGHTYDGANPGITVPFKDTITLTLTVSNGLCTEKVSIEKEVGGFGSYYYEGMMPNVFTPNEDGINECFGPSGLEEGCYKLYVYNRWGNLYFDSVKTGQGCWNGKGMNKVGLVSEGVYYWVLVVGIDEFHGTVTVYNK